eukprot:6198008-Pleurochrysis_carterae.AAC.1
MYNDSPQLLSGPSSPEFRLWCNSPCSARAWHEAMRAGVGESGRRAFALSAKETAVACSGRAMDLTARDDRTVCSQESRSSGCARCPFPELLLPAMYSAYQTSTLAYPVARRLGK